MSTHEINNQRITDPNYKYGRWLSSPLPGEEVVISGMSGRLPESDTIHEYRDHLFNKREMITDDDRRWKLDHHEIPQRTAKIRNIDKYDAGYFGVHYRQADIMDPMMRIFMETTIEAIMDAGLNPMDLQGTKTGVFMAACWSDMETETLVGMKEEERFGATGYLRSFIPHRISYYLKLKGPACVIDTACSSSMNAFDTAFKSIRRGQCDNAIVGCGNLLLHPGNSLQFFRLGVLSSEGVCKVFDQNADGYVRGETIACIFLQKAKHSRRIYAQVVGTKVNSDGFKEQGITFPSTQAQKQLMMEIYEDSHVDASALAFLEVHGTGTEVGDPQEVEAIDYALAKRRQKQLLVGSVKSSIGHTEPASGICSIIKVLIAMETGLIAPNINLKKIKDGMKGFEEGRMKVVTEVTELEGEDAIIGINNFGFGGNNAHAILKRFNKKKIHGGSPQDDIPRLVCVSGRTEEAVLNLLDDINSRSLDVEYVGLLHQIHHTNIKNHVFRGYSIISKDGLVNISSKLFTGQKLPLYVFFGHFSKNYKILALYLLNFSAFKKTITSIDMFLTSKNLKTFREILQDQTKLHEDIFGSICVQVGVVDILKLLDLHPAAVFGDSSGKLISTYYYNVINLDETISTALKISQLDLNSDLHFQAEFSKFNKLHSNDKQRSDFVSLENMIDIHENNVILNVSDLPLNSKDMLLVEGQVVNILKILGRLFEEGHTPHLHKLYPEIQYPVSRSTPMISPAIQWHHKNSWYTYKFSQFTASDAEQREYNISFLYDEYKFIKGHVIDGRNFFPATEYLNLVWQTFAQSRRLLPIDLPVTFKNCKFIRAVSMPNSGFVKLLVTIQRGTGYFEVLEKNSLVVSGIIQTSADVKQLQTHFEPPACDNENPTGILEQDEIYRELYLRGYNYSGLFKGIKKYNIESSVGLIKWNNNWTSFMDTMLQMKILQTDTRLLYVPVGIAKLTIDPLTHMELVNKLDEKENSLPVQVYEECNVIKSGGIEICGLQAKSISKRKQRLQPVLEKYQFLPNCFHIDLEEAVRVDTQIILENTLENHFKAVEIIDDYTCLNSEHLLRLVCNALDDVPLVTPDLTISSKTTINGIPGVKIDNIALTPESDLHLVVASKILQRYKILKHLLLSLNKGGFILTREDPNFIPDQIEGIETLTEFTTTSEKLILCRKSLPTVDTKFIEISSSNLSWLSELQKSLIHDSSIIVYAISEEPEGILGLVNCIRHETHGKKVKCFFMMDEAPKFDPQNRFYSEQMRKNFGINIYKDGNWGTYRHLLLEDPVTTKCDHFYANVTSRGEISTLTWLEGALTEQTPLPENNFLISTVYAAVNFKDIMVASGRVNIEAISTNRLEQECLLGFEFSGRDLSGRRVFGMNSSQSFASYVIADRSSSWEIPDSWSFEDAATVSVVYATVVQALQVKSLKPGTSVLIHSATGGIGLAALNVCIYHQCDMYVTVGTEEKRNYLNKYYPQIPNSHIGNSRDISFENMIKTETKGRGVDIVLNSLSDDKLKASVRCLARGGRFMDIGKFDLANDTALNLLFMEKEASYYGVMLDRILKDCKEMRLEISKTIEDGIKAGYVKPLPRIVFGISEIEAACRYMMPGKHIGKVLVKIRDMKEDTHSKFEAFPRFNGDVRYTYIIIGGLGGVGLELADWLILRGARKVVLVSRSGIQNGYQKQRLRIWKSYGANVQISTKDVTTKQGCRELIYDASELGPVDAIFNLAVVLEDARFEDQTEETFKASLSPKAQVVLHLDQLTRELCPRLRYFVVFSSVSCGRGNAGQSNYGMANSIMERVCERRKRQGLPALAIQWGAIGDVGLVAKMQKENKELVIGGTLQQKISSCLDVLDRFLTQDHPVVASMLVAEKHNRSYGLLSAVDAVAHVLGIKDIKTVSQHSTLAELGMDSMMGTELIQLLEKDFEIYITPKEVRSLTFARLIEIETERRILAEDKSLNKAQLGTNVLIQCIPDGRNNNIPIVKLCSLVRNEEEAPTAFVLPGIEGVFQPLDTLIKQLKAHVFGVQYNYNNPEDTVQDVASNILPHIEKCLKSKSNFFIIGYSFGASVGTELVSLLEERGCDVTFILIEGSPAYLSSSAKNFLPEETEAEFQTALIYKILFILIPLDVLEEYKGKVLKCENLNDRIDLAMTLVPSNVTNKQKLDKQAPIALYKRFRALINYEFTHEKLKSSVHLFKAKHCLIKAEYDYQLTKLCEKPVQISTVEGDHVTVLIQPELAHGINKILTFDG